MQLTDYKNGVEIEVAECLIKEVHDRKAYREITTIAGQKFKVWEQIPEILTKARVEKNERLHQGT